MAIQQPNLDDRSYADLVEEARRLITSYDPAWTNHNPSDPGITIIELFAHLTEVLNYRLNRVTDANQRKFLKLLNGPAWTPGDDLTADTRATVKRIRERFRAVTASDYEHLATETFNELLASMRAAELSGAPLDAWWDATRLDALDAAHRPSQIPPIERARCLSGKNLERGTERERTEADPGHVSLAIVPRDGDPFQPPEPLRTALWAFLDERRILTTRHHVVAPSFVPVAAEIVLARTSDAVASSLHERVAQRIEQFLDPRVGGASQAGWPFGRDVYVSELFEQLEAVSGVDYITDLMLFSACSGQARCVAAPTVWHAEGDLIGLSLAEHHLPRPTIDRLRIVSAPSDRFVALHVRVDVTAPIADAATVKRRVKERIRAFFHPLTAAPVPAPDGSAEFRRAALEAALRGMTDVFAPSVSTVQVVFDADASRLSRALGAVVGLIVGWPDERVDWRTTVTVSGT